MGVHTGVSSPAVGSDTIGWLGSGYGRRLLNSKRDVLVGPK